ncbi:MAG: hypothetical protein HUJ99_07860, partial [Bacteroidaceae bacterium]|nr:hypothetical protein [Bacteroidaceae bacterium]
MKIKYFGLLSLLLASGLVSCTSDKEIYKDPAAPIEERVNDLIGRMTVEEKIGQ